MDRPERKYSLLSPQPHFTHMITSIIQDMLTEVPLLSIEFDPPDFRMTQSSENVSLPPPRPHDPFKAFHGLRVVVSGASIDKGMDAIVRKTFCNRTALVEVCARTMTGSGIGRYLFHHLGYQT